MATTKESKCNCIKESTERVLDFVKKENDKSDRKGIIGDGHYNHQGLSLGKNGGWRTYQEFEYEFTPIKKDGSEGRQITKRISIYHTYCPFCGKKTPTDD